MRKCSNPIAAVASACAELYALLLKPLEQHLRGKDLVLAPDGMLWTLPFELLVEGRTPEDEGKYLAQTRKTRYTPSLTVLHLIRLWEKTRPTPPESLWALGDPVFSKDDPRAQGDLHRHTRDLLARYALRSGSGPDWQRLPATATEVRTIARLHGAGTEVVTDAAASEAVVKAASIKGVLGASVTCTWRPTVGSAREWADRRAWCCRWWATMARKNWAVSTRAT